MRLLTTRKYGLLMLTAAGLAAVLPARAAVIDSYTTTNLLDNAGYYLGQSFTTPGGGPWNNITFNFFLSGVPLANGTAYIFSSRYTGLVNGLSGGSNLLATSTGTIGGKYVFNPTFTLQPGTTYFLYSDGFNSLFDIQTSFLGGSSGPGGSFFAASPSSNFSFSPFATSDYSLQGDFAPSPLIYISDSQNNRIRKVDTSTGAITTVAGNGTGWFAGDGGPATSAELHNPLGVAVDSFGNLYIADTANNRVRMVNTSGTITTVAGNGTASFSGDGGPATSAGLWAPYGVAVDSLGNLYIADQSNNRIRKVASGTITTVAGNGSVGFGGDGGLAVNAGLYHPAGIAVDGSGNLYIADQSNNRVRRVNTSGIISTLAGNGLFGYNCNNGVATGLGLHAPYGVATDGSGDVFIGDYGNQCVRKVNTGNITTVAGGGYGGDGVPATSASLADPAGVAVDGSGNLYIADLVNNRVREVLSPSGIISTLAGTGAAGFAGDGGPAASAVLYNPSGVAVFVPTAPAP
jgi:sugar lactone lactonase YvrE